MQVERPADDGDRTLPDGTLLGALDLGSNSFHLTIARVSGGDLEIIERAKDKVQLAAGLLPDGNLDQAAVGRGLASIARMAERLRALAPEQVYVVGTSALRQAGNRDEFLLPAAALLGVPVQVISGEQEARLIFQGVANMIADDGDRLVIDIGGGSTEFAVGTGFDPYSSLSVPAGCVTLTKRFFSGEGPYAPRLEEALVQVRRMFAGLRPQLGTWQEVLGTSGSVESVHEVLEVNGWSDGSITRAGLAQIRAVLGSCRLGVDPGIAGLAPERNDIFPAGVVILDAAMAELGIDQLTFSEGTLQDGLLFEALGVPQQDNVRNRSVLLMQRRFQVDQGQAARVALLARQLLGQVAEPLGLADDGCGELLRWAAELHEVGLAVAHSHHERHGAYLVQNSALRGFRPLQRQSLALLLRSHRRGLSTLAFAAFDPRQAERLRWLSVLLRLSVLFCRGRIEDRQEEINLSVRDAGLDLELPEHWLRDHPLGRDDLAREQGLLAAAGIRLGLHQAQG